MSIPSSIRGRVLESPISQFLHKSNEEGCLESSIAGACRYFWDKDPNFLWLLPVARYFLNLIDSLASQFKLVITGEGPGQSDQRGIDSLLPMQPLVLHFVLVEETNPLKTRLYARIATSTGQSKIQSL